jgi:hypothetical protein
MMQLNETKRNLLFTVASCFINCMETILLLFNTDLNHTVSLPYKASYLSLFPYRCVVSFFVSFIMASILHSLHMLFAG